MFRRRTDDLSGLDGSGSRRSYFCLQSKSEFLLSLCVFGAKQFVSNGML